MNGPGDWTQHGACVDKPADWFFPDNRGLRVTDFRVDEAAGLATCARCPVIDQCKAYALRHELHGTWGGLTARQRRTIRRRNGIRLRDPLPFTVRTA